ncbi:M15 family metallopeptidase [Desulfosediminicola sp.]|uniref:M15 family metallopeptidase n=1 Tax=Desulfosediminicola sp. TaxID=2886825 RepID=UPI003AF25B19
MFTNRYLPILSLLALMLITPLDGFSTEFPKIAKLEDKIYRGKETVWIGDKEYDVPYPWRGNKIPAPAIPPSNFSQIPVEHTKDGSRLYVTRQTHASLLKLFDKAREDGFHFKVESGYRSPDYQRRIFLRKFKEGRDFDDVIRYVAPPGYSQHALGTCVDFAPGNWRFGQREEYQWLKRNASAYGFTETYPQKNKYNYPWESWHWNYSPNDDPHIQDDIDIQPENSKDQEIKILAEKELDNNQIPAS